MYDYVKAKYPQKYYTRNESKHVSSAQIGPVQKRSTDDSAISHPLDFNLSFSGLDEALPSSSRGAVQRVVAPRVMGACEKLPIHQDAPLVKPHHPVQLDGGGDVPTSKIHEAANHGIRTASTTLPYAREIQKSFGHHDISGISYHNNPEASKSARAMNAQAYATAEHVVSVGQISKHTAAHEAAHHFQQQGGVRLKDNVGSVGDQYERHADAVGDAVVQGKSAEGLLDQYADYPSFTSNSLDKNVVQRLYYDHELDEYYSNILSGKKIDEDNGVITVVSNNVLGGGHSTIFTEHMKPSGQVALTTPLTTRIDLFVGAKEGRLSSIVGSSGSTTGSTSTESGYQKKAIVIKVREYSSVETPDKLSNADDHRSWVRTTDQIESAIDTANNYSGDAGQEEINKKFKYKLFGKGKSALNCAKFAGMILKAAGVEDAKLKSSVLGIYKPANLTEGLDEDYEIDEKFLEREQE